MQSGAQSVGIALAFNTVGWGRSNLLFAALDALLGDPLISDGVRRPPEPVRGARVGHEQPDHVGRRRLRDGDVDRADPRGRSRNDATSAPAAIMGAGGMSAAAILASSMVNSRARAFVEDRPIDAGGDVTVAASDEARDRRRRRRCTPRSRRRTTRAPGSSTVGEPLARRVRVHAALRHARRRLRRQGARRRRRRSTSTWARPRTVDFGDRGPHRLRLWKVLTPVEPDHRLRRLRRARDAGHVRLGGSTGRPTATSGSSTTTTSAAWSRRTSLRAPVTTTGDVTVSARRVAELVAFDESVTQRVDGQGRRHRHQRRCSRAPPPTSRTATCRRRTSTSLPQNTLDDGRDGDARRSSPGTTLSAVVAFNSIGWKPSNLLFNAVDALVGDPLISERVRRRSSRPRRTAYIRDADVTASRRPRA